MAIYQRIDADSIPINLGNDLNTIRLRQRKRPTSWWPRLLVFTLMGMGVVASLNYTGVARIPGLEFLSKDNIRTTERPLTRSGIPPAGPSMPLRVESPAGGVGRPDLSRSIRTATADSGRPAQSTPARRNPPRPEKDLDEPAPPAEDAAQVLANNGIIRSPSGFVLGSESEALTKLAMLRSKAADFNVAAERLGVVRRIAELDQMVTAANASIAELDFQMGQFPVTSIRGRWFHGMTTADEDAYQELNFQRANIVRARDTSLVPERNTLRSLSGAGLAQAIDAFRTRREAALDALREMRGTVAAVTKGYSDLSARQDIRQALSRMGQAQLKPSQEFLDAAREGSDFEKSAARLGLIPAR